MTYIATINAPQADHLAKVIEEMRVLGAPKLRAYRDETQGLYVALEGSHRVAAAHALGLVPELIVLDGDDRLLCGAKVEGPDCIDFDDCGWFEGEPARVEDIAARIGQPNSTYAGCPIYRFEV